jgi:hypothetical protein
MKAAKGALDFPRWVEAAIILGLLVMAVVESCNEQWFWAAIFGIAGVLFGAGFASRLITGDKKDGD